MNPLQRFFDFCVSSELPLPGLPGCEGDAAAWHIDAPCDNLEEESFEQIHSWTSAAGEAVMTVSRRGSDYLLECPGLARFRIDFAARRITPRPLADCAENSLVHLLLDQVLPRAVCHQGRFVMHASAVRLTDGRVIAFSGPSGRGKSTLALAFMQAGHEVITDDCLSLEPADGRVRAIPAYPSMRLWPDSLDTLMPLRGVQVSAMAHYTRKKQLRFTSSASMAGWRPLELSALYLLAEPETGGKNGAVCVEPVSGSAAIMAMIESLFVLDVRDRGVTKSNFERAGRMAAVVPVFRLVYPRDFGILTRVVEKLDSF